MAAAKYTLKERYKATLEVNLKSPKDANLSNESTGFRHHIAPHNSQPMMQARGQSPSIILISNHTING